MEVGNFSFQGGGVSFMDVFRARVSFECEKPTEISATRAKHRGNPLATPQMKRPRQGKEDPNSVRRSKINLRGGRHER